MNTAQANKTYTNYMYINYSILHTEGIVISANLCESGRLEIYDN